MRRPSFLVFVGLPAGETYQVAGKGAGYRTKKKVTLDASTVTTVPVISP